MVQETRETRRCERLKSDDISPPFEICLTMPLIKIDVACDKNICRPPVVYRHAATSKEAAVRAFLCTNTDCHAFFDV